MPTTQALPIAHPTFSTGASFRHLLSLTRIHFRETTKNVFFLVLMLAGFLFAVLTAAGINNPIATKTYPVTYQMLELAGAGFFIFAIAIIIFYSGELVWRERDAQLNQVIDAFPLQRWVLFSSKLFALMLVQVVVVLLILASGVTVQIAQGFPHIEFGLYFRELFLNRLTSLWILCVSGDIRSDHRQQQISRPFRDGALHRGHAVVCRRPDFRIISIASARRPRSRIPTSTAMVRFCSRSSGSGCIGA